MLLVAVLALAGALAVREGLARLNALGPLAADQSVVVPRGSPARVAEALQQAGVVRHAPTLRIAALLTAADGPLRAGEFLFPAQGSLAQVLAVLRQGRPVQHRLTLPEGLTAAAIALLLDRTDTLDGDAVVPFEGQVLPETYLHERGTPRTALVERATRAMERALAAAWDSRAPNLPLASPREMLVLASIVERETAKPEERARVAQVFINRLNRGMRLQSDPTVVYAASGGIGTLDRPISRADLDLANPYNTYRNAGLPPGPIASPGAASLAAVAQPSGGNDLYFVADGTGGHAFAATLDEHNRNVAKWRALNR